MAHATDEGAQASSTSSGCATSSSARAQIPDQPSLNPIVNVAFNLSRRLEAGEISFDELKALAGPADGPRLRAARAALARAARLRRQRDDTQPSSRSYVAESAGRSQKMARLRALQGALEPRAHRHRSDGAPDVRPVGGAVAAHDRDRARGHAPTARRSASPHRPDAPLTLDYEHSAPCRRDPQSARRLRRSAARLLQRRRRKLSATRRYKLSRAGDDRLVGRLRPRRPHRHQVDVLVPRSASRRSARRSTTSATASWRSSASSATAARCSA